MRLAAARGLCSLPFPDLFRKSVYVATAAKAMLVLKASEGVQVWAGKKHPLPPAKCTNPDKERVLVAASHVAPVAHDPVQVHGIHVVAAIVDDKQPRTRPGKDQAACAWRWCWGREREVSRTCSIATARNALRQGVSSQTSFKHGNSKAPRAIIGEAFGCDKALTRAGFPGQPGKAGG